MSPWWWLNPWLYALRVSDDAAAEKNANLRAALGKKGAADGR